jgi:hypothetical protein
MKRLLASILLASAPAFAGFSWNIRITFDHTKVGAGTENESSFPVVLTPGDASLKTIAGGGKIFSSTGADILAYSDSGCTTQLPSELPWYDGTNGNMELWVQVSTLSYTANTSVYICVGNASPPSRTTGVWDGNFKGVWHVPNGSSLTVGDSTANGNSASNLHSSSAAAGKIDGAAGFTGSTWIDIPDSTSLNVTSAYSISTWIYRTGNVAPFASIFGLLYGNGSNSPYICYDLELDRNSLGSDVVSILQNYSSGGFTSVDSPANTVPQNTWVLVYATWDGTTLRLYANGSPVGSAPVSGGIAYNSTQSLGIGGIGAGGMVGALDELRLSNTARSAGWISTEYQNQSNPGSIGSPGFATFGSWLSTTGNSGNSGISILM